MADLTTLAKVKAWLPIVASTTSEDTLLSGLITSTSADFMRSIRRPDLLTATYTEIREGDGANRLLLRHWPITAVSLLTIGGVTINPSTDQIAPGWYLDVDIDPERLNQLYLAVYNFLDGATIVVEYAGGYSAVPADIEQAVIDWVVYRYKGRPNVGTVSRRSTEGEDVRVEALDAPTTTKAVIMRYCRELPSIDRRGDDRQQAITRINRTYTEKM